MANEVAETVTNEALVAQQDKASTLALLTDSHAMESAMELAGIMASSTMTVPKHLQGKKGDCMAIVLQAMNWGMNPFVVAQKTHLVNGVLGYEAQLVNAVVQAQGFINGSFTYEYQGIGASMKCRVGAVLKGQHALTWGEWLGFSDVTTKNSPLWKTNPKQQMGYLQVKNWARLYCPQAILGVYTSDELDDSPLEEKDVTDTAPTYMTDEEFKDKWEKMKQTFLKGLKAGSTLENFYVYVDNQGKLLTESQKEEIATWVPIEGEAKEVKEEN